MNKNGMRQEAIVVACSMKTPEGESFEVTPNFTPDT